MTALALSLGTIAFGRLPSTRRLMALLGPGAMVAVGYMDPGNWATDIAAGARHGTALLSAVLLASLAGVVLQALVVRLTLATGQDLARLVRQSFPGPVSGLIWLVSELALVATDLAELLGGAIALNLLLGLPILAGIGVSALITVLVLAAPGMGGRAPELVVAALVAGVAVGFGIELVMARPDAGAVLRGFVPTAGLVRDPEQIYLALGILGATVMPHNLFLHAGLARASLARAAPADRRRTGRWLILDSTAALGLAFLVNAAILVVAATAFHAHAVAADATPGIADAYRLLGSTIGGGAALVFALALFAAGQSATATGTMAGQIVTEGFLDLRLAPWLRSAITRSVALVPALAVPLVAGDGAVARLLVLSQVVLGLALPFVVVPMLLLLRDRRLMGRLALPRPALHGAGVLIATLIGLSGWLAATSFA